MESEWKKVLEDGTVVTRTCGWSPPGCHPVGCGMKLHVKDGKLIKVEGDKEHPITNGRLCPRCLALPEYVHHPDRIIYPMRRKKEDRGYDRWERITWDEAWEDIEFYYKDTVEKYGSESIVVFEGTGREASTFYGLFEVTVMNTPNGAYTQSGWSCYGPRIAITSFLLGAGFLDYDWAGAFPLRYNEPTYEIPKYLVTWGKAPLESNPDGMFGHAVIDLMKRGTELIVIDPRINWLATRAKYVLQLRPGTDAALGLGLLNVIINEDLYDHDFVDNWTYGFEELKARVQDYPPSRVAAITWVAEEDIIEVAREMAKRPVTHGWGVSVDQNANGVQVGQVIVSIAAITGNLDNPGGTSLGVPLPGVVLNPMSSAGDLEPSELWDKIIGGEEFPAVKAAMRKVQPDAMLDALETDEPYKFHFAWWHSSNTIAPTNSAQPKRWHEALKRIDYTVCTDVFMTPTAMAFADIFLPVSTFAEHDGIVDTNYGLNVCQIGAINKALQVGECKSDIEILFELGRRIAPGRLPWKDPEEYFANVLNGAGMTFDDLRKAGTWQPGATYYKHEKGLVRPDGQPGFNTVTGKVELYALMYENFGDDPLPYFREPPFSAIDAPEYAEEYPLILTTGSRRFTSFHSEHRQIPTLRELSPNPLVQINPETAAKAGIKDGQWVKLENPFGSCKMVAMLTPIVPPKVVNAEHGWWFPEEDGEEPNLFGVWKSNVNSLIPHRAVGKMGFGAPYKSMICKISPVAE